MGRLFAPCKKLGRVNMPRVLAAALKTVTASPAGSPRTVEQFLAGQTTVDLSIYDTAFNKCSRKVEDSLEDFLDKHEQEFIVWTPLRLAEVRRTRGIKSLLFDRLRKRSASVPPFSCSAKTAARAGR